MLSPLPFSSHLPSNTENNEKLSDNFKFSNNKKNYNLEKSQNDVTHKNFSSWTSQQLTNRFQLHDLRSLHKENQIITWNADVNFSGSVYL